MRKYFSEFFGTAILTITMMMTLIYVSSFQLGAVFDIMIIAGLTLAGLMFLFGPFSDGGHFNPAVSLGAALQKAISWKTFAGYAIAQLLGAILGVGVALATLMPVLNGAASGQSVKSSQLLSSIEPTATVASLAESLTIEFFVTLIFVFVTLVAIKQNKKLSPVIVGLFMTIATFLSYPLTGGLLNPARVFAPLLYKGLASAANPWYFLLIELAAGIVAGFLAKYFVKDNSAVIEEEVTVESK